MRRQIWTAFICVLLACCFESAYSVSSAETMVLKDVSMPVYARGFYIEHYEGGYAMIHVDDTEVYLVIPDGKEIPVGIDDEVILIRQPVTNAYLAATSAMSLMDSLETLDAIRFSGIQRSGWFVENAVFAMEQGKIIFAGKYSEPDYELLLSAGCDLAIENMNLLNVPQVKEKLEMLSIPVFIDRSSNEPHPLGRLEWIKVYGTIFGKEERADQMIQEQLLLMEETEGCEQTGKKVAVFYINNEGMAMVRNPADYVARMVEMAGGTYVPADIGAENSKALIPLTMESFYAQAVDADYIIYNATMQTAPASIEELIQMNELLADFKAVREGHVWYIDNCFFQATDRPGQFVWDLKNMLSDKYGNMFFLNRVN